GRRAANRAAAEREVGAVKTRLWLAWLAGSSIAFARGTACVFQTLASKRVRGPSGLPPTRADLYGGRGGPWAAQRTSPRVQGSPLPITCPRCHPSGIADSPALRRDSHFIRPA